MKRYKVVFTHNIDGEEKETSEIFEGDISGLNNPQRGSYWNAKIAEKHPDFKDISTNAWYLVE